MIPATNLQGIKMIKQCVKPLATVKFSASFKIIPGTKTIAYKPFANKKDPALLVKDKFHHKKGLIVSGQFLNRTFKAKLLYEN